MRQQKRKLEAALLDFFPDLVSKLDQQPSQPSRHRLSQRDPASILQRKPIFLAYALHSAHLRLFVAAKKSKKPLAFYRP